MLYVCVTLFYLLYHLEEKLFLLKKFRLEKTRFNHTALHEFLYTYICACVYISGSFIADHEPTETIDNVQYRVAQDL